MVYSNRIKRSLLLRLKHLSVDTGQDQRTILEDALAAWLDRHEKKSK